MKIRFLFACSILLLCLPATGLGQSTYGAVVGVAADSSGAVLPNATVTLTEVQTTFARTSVTDQTGAFEFQNLTQGLYRIDAELSGFQKFTTEPVLPIVRVT